MSNCLTTYKDFSQSIETQSYEYYIFDLFLNEIANNCNHSVETLDYLVSDNQSSLTLCPDLESGNIRVYKLDERKKKNPNKLLVIYNHKKIRFRLPSSVVEYVKTEYKDYQNLLYLIPKELLRASEGKITGMKYVHDRTMKNDYYRYIIKEVENFSMKDIDMFRPDTESVRCCGC